MRSVYIVLLQHKNSVAHGLFSYLSMQSVAEWNVIKVT